MTRLLLAAVGPGPRPWVWLAAAGLLVAGLLHLPGRQRGVPRSPAGGAGRRRRRRQAPCPPRRRRRRRAVVDRGVRAVLARPADGGVDTECTAGQRERRHAPLVDHDTGRRLRRRDRRGAVRSRQRVDRRQRQWLDAADRNGAPGHAGAAAARRPRLQRGGAGRQRPSSPDARRDAHRPAGRRRLWAAGRSRGRLRRSGKRNPLAAEPGRRHPRPAGRARGHRPPGPPAAAGRHAARGGGGALPAVRLPGVLAGAGRAGHRGRGRAGDSLELRGPVGRVPPARHCLQGRLPSTHEVTGLACGWWRPG